MSFYRDERFVQSFIFAIKRPKKGKVRVRESREMQENMRKTRNLTKKINKGGKRRDSSPFRKKLFQKIGQSECQTVVGQKSIKKIQIEVKREDILKRGNKA